MRIALLIVPLIFLSSCVIGGNNRTTGATGEKGIISVSSNTEDTKTTPSGSGDFSQTYLGNSISLIRSGNRIFLKRNNKIIENWEEEIPGELPISDYGHTIIRINSCPYLTTNKHESSEMLWDILIGWKALTINQKGLCLMNEFKKDIILGMTNKPKYITLTYSYNPFSKQYIDYQSWSYIIDVENNIAYPTYDNVIYNIKDLSLGYLVNEASTFDGSGKLETYTFDWNKRNESGTQNHLNFKGSEKGDMDSIFGEICRSSPLITLNLYDIFGESYGMLVRNGNVLTYFQNRDGPLYQYSDTWVDKRNGYEGFEQFDCTNSKSQEVISGKVMKKIELSLPKVHRGNYVADLGDYSFSQGILRFDYGEYIGLEGPFELKLYYIVVDTNHRTIKISDRDSRFSKKITY